MRKRRIVWGACGVALLSLAVAGAMADRAAAQSRGTPWLGVTTQEITSELREGLDYQGDGVIVNRVIADSPAERAGIRKGDVIVSFNSRTVDSPSELVDLVRATRVGQSVAVIVVRDGSRRTMNARLAEWPQDIEDSEDEWTPAPAPSAPRSPTAPRAPKAPSAPRGYSFEWNGETFDLPDVGDMSLLRGMGHGRLGVQIQELNSGLAEALEVPGGKGVLVIEVFEDTPAERAGMKAGDVITRVGDTTVDDVDDLHRAIQDHEGRVSITVMRRGVRRTVEAELGAKRQVTRIRRGDGPTGFRIPDVRTRVRRDVDGGDAGRGELEQQLRELRQEMRELRQKLEAMDKD
jgi:membrane-associated protease RseP (regulator of RpoE activity)